jgi:MSHA biogenesis protein MshP
MSPSRQRGFAYIAAIVFLVVLAGFALAALRLTGAEQATVNQQVQGARANQAARAGLEWAFFRLKTAGATCAAIQSATLADFVTDTGYRVTLTCTMNTYAEGQTPAGDSLLKNIFQLTATACNGAGASCPDNGSVTAQDYVERRRSASICVTQDGHDCY